MGKLCLSPLSILFLCNEMKKLIYSLFVLTMLFGMASCEEKPVEGKPVLTVSTDLFVADGEEGVEFTVKVGDVDVTAESTIYVDNKPITGNFFTTTEAKFYKAFAIYNGQTSNKLSIQAANPALYVELPEDTLADKFSEFHHNVLMTQATGTWCGWCPYMIRSIELFRENGSNAANTVVVATHSNDVFSCKASEAAVSALHVQGFPSSFFNLNPEAIVENNDPNINAEVINASAGMELKEKANVGIAATVATNSSKSVIAVRAAVKVGKTGAYRINAWLVEDKLPAYQSSNWYEFSNGMSTVLIEHDFVLRGASCLSPIQGELLGGKSSCEQGETIEYYYEFDADDADFVDVANCKVVVLVSAASGKNFYVNNVIECSVGKSVPFAYN